MLKSTLNLIRIHVLKQTQLWGFILLASLNASLLMATPIDSDFTENAKEIEKISNTLSNELLNNQKPIKLIVDNNLPNKGTEDEPGARKNLNGHTYRFYHGLNNGLNIGLNDENKNNNILQVKPTTLILDYALNKQLKSTQPIANPQVLVDRNLLALSTIFSQPKTPTQANPGEDSNSNASVENISEINREDIAYIEEELLYSKESGISYGDDDTSEAVRLLTFYSLDLDDRTLIWAVLLLLSALICIAIYVRFFKD